MGIDFEALAAVVEQVKDVYTGADPGVPPKRRSRAELIQRAHRFRMFRREEIIDAKFVEDDDDFESKVVRHVRTPAGVRRFGQPIGSIIVRDSVRLPHIEIMDTDFPGWEMVRGKDGEKYYIGKYQGEKFYTGTTLDDKEVVRADTEDDVYEALDEYVADRIGQRDGKRPPSLVDSNGQVFGIGDKVRVVGEGQGQWVVRRLNANHSATVNRNGDDRDVNSEDVVRVGGTSVKPSAAPKKPRKVVRRNPPAKPSTTATGRSGGTQKPEPLRKFQTGTFRGLGLREGGRYEFDDGFVGTITHNPGGWFEAEDDDGNIYEFPAGERITVRPADAPKPKAKPKKPVQIPQGQGAVTRRTPKKPAASLVIMKHPDAKQASTATRNGNQYTVVMPDGTSKTMTSNRPMTHALVRRNAEGQYAAGRYYVSLASSLANAQREANVRKGERAHIEIVPIADSSAPTPKSPRAAKKPAGSKTPRAAGAPSAKKLLSQGGGDLEPKEKVGKEHVAPLDPKPPKVKKARVTHTKAKKVSRTDQKDYKFVGGKPEQSDELRKQAHLAAGGSQKAIDNAAAKGKPFRLAPARDNEHLWFPKDPNSPIAYSYRQSNPKLNPDGTQVYKVNADGTKTPVWDGTFQDRKVEYKKEFKDANAAAKDARIIDLAEHMHELDAALQKDARTDDTAASVLLMRMLAIRPNTKDEEAQERDRAKKSKLKARSLRARGIDPDQPIFGATSLRAKHVILNGDEVTIDFMGKEHVRNTHHVTDSFLADVLRRHLKGKTGDDELFPDTDAVKTSAYIRRHLGPSYTNKDLRSYAATWLAAEMIRGRTPPQTQAEFDMAQAEIALAVSMTTNNKAAQVLGSYIAGGVWDGWRKGIKDDD